MIFEEWYKKEGFDVLVADLLDEYPSEHKIKKLMKDAWDARYEAEIAEEGDWEIIEFDG